jgi:hypothetical protein
MIFGQVMVKIRHGGRHRTVAIRSFLAVVGCCVILLVAVAQKMSAGYFRSAGFLGSSLLIIRRYCCRFDNNQQSIYELESTKHHVSTYYQGYKVTIMEYVEHSRHWCA